MKDIIKRQLSYELTIIFYIASLFIVICAAYDAFIFWDHKVVAFQWSNSFLFIITVIAFLLGLRKIVSMATSMAIIIYTVLCNFYFIFLSGYFVGDIVLHFLRDSFFIPIIFVCLALVSGKVHLFISTVLYFILIVLFTFAEHSNYMQNNLFFFFLILLGSSLGIFLFIKHLENNLKRSEEVSNVIESNNKNLLNCKAELELNNDFKNHLISVISHDLRNEMGNIKMAIDFMIRNGESMSADVRQRYEQNLYIASEKSLNLLDNFLVWAKSGRDGIIFNKETLHLDKLVNSAIEQIKHRAEDKKIRIIPIGLDVYVRADYYSLLAVIRNLLHNAIKFSGKSATITVKATQNDSQVAIHVADQGVGIPLETMERMMNSDYFISTPGTANEVGSGLGLAICKDFIKKNDGQLSIQSKPGEGTSVIIVLDKG